MNLVIVIGHGILMVAKDRAGKTQARKRKTGVVRNEMEDQLCSTGVQNHNIAADSTLFQGFLEEIA